MDGFRFTVDTALEYTAKMTMEAKVKMAQAQGQPVPEFPSADSLWSAEVPSLERVFGVSSPSEQMYAVSVIPSQPMRRRTGR